MDKFNPQVMRERMHLEEARRLDYLAHEERLKLVRDEAAPELGNVAVELANREAINNSDANFIAEDIAPILSGGLMESKPASIETNEAISTINAPEALGQTALYDAEIAYEPQPEAATLNAEAFRNQINSLDIKSYDFETIATANYQTAA